MAQEVWTLLFQSALLGKARELAPEAYRQKFRNSKKSDAHAYVEFARTKETLFDHWCTSKEVQKTETISADVGI